MRISKSCTIDFIRGLIFPLLGVVEIIRGQSQVQLPHHQADSSELSRQRVPTLEAGQLLLHLAPERAAGWDPIKTPLRRFQM